MSAAGITNLTFLEEEEANFTMLEDFEVLMWYDIIVFWSLDMIFYQNILRYLYDTILYQTIFRSSPSETLSTWPPTWWWAQVRGYNLKLSLVWRQSYFLELVLCGGKAGSVQWINENWISCFSQLWVTIVVLKYFIRSPWPNKLLSQKPSLLSESRSGKIKSQGWSSVA